MTFKKLSEIGDVEGSKVFVRVDFNVPTVEEKVADGFRIQAALPTINFLRERGARVILISHIENGEEATLLPVRDYLAKYFEVNFCEAADFIQIESAILNLRDGEVLLLENIRRFAGEEENDEMFSRHLAEFGDVYVNEAFSVSHRKHASIVGLPKFLPSFAGLRFEREVDELSKVLENPEKSFLFVLGGAKFETKEPLIERFLDIADNIFLGGALANDFLKGRGNPVGVSKVSDTVPEKELLDNKKIITPLDVIVGGKNDARVVKEISEVGRKDAIYDVGPKTIAELKKIIDGSKTILWNGPLGLYEKGFVDGSEGLAKIIARSSAYSIIGGGDTLASIRNLKLENKFSFVSTGGGAMLDFLSSGTLAGIEALKNSNGS